MSEIIGSGDGKGTPAPLQVMLTLHPTPQGYGVQIDHTPGMFPDQIIDACQRAIRFYERQALIVALQNKDHQTGMARQMKAQIDGRLSLS